MRNNKARAQGWHIILIILLNLIIRRPFAETWGRALYICCCRPKLSQNLKLIENQLENKLTPEFSKCKLETRNFWHAFLAN